MCAASWRAATITSSSVGYIACAFVVLPTFMCMHSSGECCLSLQSSDCGTMIVLIWVAGPLSARKMSSKARLRFLYDPSV